jgi:D-isomer specific 2-hydroxyacid dehydrogenase, catalytic domain
VRSDASLERIVGQTNADVWPDEMSPQRDELLRRVEGVDELLTMVTDRVDDELLERAGPQLKVVELLRTTRWRLDATSTSSTARPALVGVMSLRHSAARPRSTDMTPT